MLNRTDESVCCAVHSSGFPGARQARPAPISQWILASLLERCNPLSNELSVGNLMLPLHTNMTDNRMSCSQDGEERGPPDLDESQQLWGTDCESALPTCFVYCTHLQLALQACCFNVREQEPWNLARMWGAAPLYVFLEDLSLNSSFMMATGVGQVMKSQRCSIGSVANTGQLGRSSSMGKHQGNPLFLQMAWNMCAHSTQLPHAPIYPKCPRTQNSNRNGLGGAGPPSFLWWEP